MLMWYETKKLKAALQSRGLSPLAIHRTITKRGADAAYVAYVATAAMPPDAAVALFEGLLHAPYGAQRAAEVIKHFLPSVANRLPGRSVGTGVHAGRLRDLLQQAAKAVPHVGQPAEAAPVAADVKAAVQAAIVAFRQTTLWASDWRQRNWRLGSPYTETTMFRHSPVTLTVVRRPSTEGPVRWVARAEVNTSGGAIRLNADALERMGIFLAV